MQVIDFKQQNVQTNANLRRSYQIILKELSNIMKILATLRTADATRSPLELMVRYRF